MAKRIFGMGILAMVLVFGMAATGCDTGSTGGSNHASSDGRITITGLHAYNGKYIIGAEGVMKVGNILLVAASSLNWDEQIVTGGRVNNGNVTLNVLRFYDGNFIPFTGNGIGAFALASSATAIVDYNDDYNDIESIGFVEINFLNGGGSGPLTLELPSWAQNPGNGDNGNGDNGNDESRNATQSDFLGTWEMYESTILSETMEIFEDRIVTSSIVTEDIYFEDTYYIISWSFARNDDHATRDQYPDGYSISSRWEGDPDYVTTGFLLFLSEDKESFISAAHAEPQKWVRK